MHLHRTVILGALAALAVPATAVAAQPPMRPAGPLPVPEGQVQHTVRNVSWQTDVGKPWARRVETWASADAGRIVHRDQKSGALLGDCFEDRRGVRCYSAEEH